MTAFMPDPHTLLIVEQGIETGIPARMEACLAGACPRPAANTQPIMTSSISLGAHVALSIADLMAIEPRSVARKLEKTPSRSPIGVRAEPTITTGSRVSIIYQSPIYISSIFINIIEHI